jgi:protoheme IX farnesyltransferase
MPSHAEIAAPVQTASRHNALKLYMDLGKFRLSMLVTATAISGYLLATRGTTDVPTLIWLSAGTLLSAMGANGFNQWIERERDALMARTAVRPLPSGEMAAGEGFALALTSSIVGVLLLATQVNLLTAGLALLTILLYALVYTPMKLVGPSCTLVGAVCGAIPPLMGWSAATDSFGYGGIALAALLFVWQIPHFLGLAWMYKDEYASGGYRMLPVVEPTGTSTGQMMLVYSVALIPVALLLSVGAVSGWRYGVLAIALGAAMVALSWRFYFARTRDTAKHLFLGSLLYLPLLLTMMILDPPRQQGSGLQHIMTSPALSSQAQDASTVQYQGAEAGR